MLQASSISLFFQLGINSKKIIPPKPPPPLPPPLLWYGIVEFNVPLATTTTKYF